MNVREWALPIYTILTQTATGMLLILWGLRGLSLRRFTDCEWDTLLRRPVLVILLTLLAGMIGSHFHLSRPLLSFMAVLNVRTSWLSREILFTVAMLLTCTLLASQIWFGPHDRQRLKTGLGWLGVVLGVAMIFCMGRIYQLPTQAPWNHWTTVPIFLSSSLVLGALSTAALLNLDAILSLGNQVTPEGSRLNFMRFALVRLAAAAAFGLLLVLTLNAVQIAAARSGDDLMQTSLALLLALYPTLFWLRIAFLLAGVIGFIAIVVVWVRRGQAIHELTRPVYFACLLVLAAEILGRFLFYATHVRIGL